MLESLASIVYSFLPSLYAILSSLFFDTHNDHASDIRSRPFLNILSSFCSFSGPLAVPLTSTVQVYSFTLYWFPPHNLCALDFCAVISRGCIGLPGGYIYSVWWDIILLDCYSDIPSHSSSVLSAFPEFDLVGIAHTREMKRRVRVYFM